MNMWQLIKKPFFKNFLTLVSGTLIAQVFTLAVYPVLTYLYPPSEFGIFGLFSAVVITVATLSNGGYNNTIMLPKKTSDAYNLLFLCGIFVVAFTLLSGIVIFTSYEIIERSMKSTGEYHWLFLVPLSLFFEGFYFSLSAMLNREGNYKILTAAKVLQAFISGISSIALGYGLNDIQGGLIIGMILGQFSSFVIMMITISRCIPREEINWGQIKEMAGIYKDFPKYGLAASYLNGLARQIPFFIIPVYFSAEVLGHFTLANKILTAPINFIGSSISQIYYQKAARAKNEGSMDLKKLNARLVSAFGALAVVPVVLIILFGQEIFSFVFGSDYAQAGLYAQWLVAWVALMYILNPLSFMIDIFGKLKFYLSYNILLILSRIAISVFGGIYLTAELTIALFGITGFLFSFTMLLWLINLGAKQQFS